MSRHWLCPCPELADDCPYFNHKTEGCDIGGDPVESCDDASWAVGDNEEE